MIDLSIIIPIYQVESYIDQCIQSVLNQTFRDFELILVNDGSFDRCPQMCNQWAKEDNRIKVIHKENGGPQAAVMAGLEIANGQYVGFVDGDDWIAPDFFDKLLATIKASHADLAITGMAIHDGNKIVQRIIPTLSGMMNSEQVKNHILSPFWEEGELLSVDNSRCNKLWKKDKIDTIISRLNPSLSMGEDLELTLRYLPLCEKIAVCPDYTGYFYRQNSESLMHKFSEKTFRQYEALKEMLRKVASEQSRAYTGQKKRESELSFHCLYQLYSSKQPFNYYIHWAKKILDAGPIMIPKHISKIARPGFSMLSKGHYLCGTAYLCLYFLAIKCFMANRG